jgi:hypothetical protein
VSFCLLAIGSKASLAVKNMVAMSVSLDIGFVEGSAALSSFHGNSKETRSIIFFLWK